MAQLNMNQVEILSSHEDQICRIYLKENEQLMPFMNLEKFVVTVLDCPFNLVLQQFQNVLRELLSSFCGGWTLSTTFKTTFPSFYWNSKVDARKVKRLYPLLIRLRESPEVRKPFLINAIKKTEKSIEHPQLNTDDAACIISEGYKILSELITEYGQTKAFGSVEVESLGDPQVVYGDLGDVKISILKEWQSHCRKNLSDLVSGVYIHGSMATLDYTEFSDLDVILIPRSETIEDPKALKELAYGCITSSCFLYKFNYLQHGGYLMFSPHDLRHYDTSILPPEVFRYSKLLWGNNKIDIDTKISKLNHFTYIWRMIQNIRCYSHKKLPVKNMWHLCVFTSLILILPVLYLQIVNDYVYKTFSFDRAKTYFSPDEWEAVDIALKIRDIWRYQPTVKETLLAYTLLELRKNPILFEYLMRHCSSRLPDNLQNYLSRRDFYRKAFLFSETVAQKVYGLAEGLYENSSDKTVCAATV